MNATLERLIESPPQPLKLVVQGALGVGMFAIILVGALFFLLDKDYTLTGQIIAGVIGAILGAIFAWRISRLSAYH